MDSESLESSESSESSEPPPTEAVLRQKHQFLKDEFEWVKEETKFIDKILPILSNKYVLKFFLLVVILILLFRFFPIFITLIFSLFTSYIKFKRTKFGFPIEIEPTYLFSIVLMLAFGFYYGLFYILIPVAIPLLIAWPGASSFINISFISMGLFSLFNNFIGSASKRTHTTVITSFSIRYSIDIPFPE